MQPFTALYRGKQFIVKAMHVQKSFFDIPLKPWIQQIVDSGQHMKELKWSEQLTLSTKCLGELTSGLMSLNMVSEDF